MPGFVLTIVSLMLFALHALAAEPVAAVEFCLDGEFDLAARLQGMHPRPGEFSEARWCVVTEPSTDRVRFHGSGKSNPDMQGDFVVSYMPPDTVRIVNRGARDLEFKPTPITDEARRYRRIDPRRLVEELEAHREWVVEASAGNWYSVRYPGSPADVMLRIVDGKLMTLKTAADLPLRGRVPVHWNWQWSDERAPLLEFIVDGDVVFRARGQWRTLAPEEAGALWRASGDQPPREIPGDAWPARIAMQLETLDDGVYIVRGVRTGFHHLVVDTEAGLVVGDAPAGWVELPQIPPADLVPGLGISGLSERFIDFLADKLPGRPLRAVVLTHVHDDHAGGARAFAAAGADVYAPASIASFLEATLNRETMPTDRFSALDRHLDIEPVSDRLRLADALRPVRLINLGAGPHVAASLGIEAAGYFFQSDLHVASSEREAPPPARAITECWFAGWAVENLSPDTVVLGSHGNVRTPVSRFQSWLDSDACQAAPRPH